MISKSLLYCLHSVQSYILNYLFSILVNKQTSKKTLCLCISPWAYIIWQVYINAARGFQPLSGLSPLKMLRNIYKPRVYIQRFKIFILPNIGCQSSINPTVIIRVIYRNERCTVCTCASRTLAWPKLCPDNKPIIKLRAISGGGILPPVLEYSSAFQLDIIDITVFVNLLWQIWKIICDILY